MPTTPVATVTGPHPASGPGALDHYAVTCSKCGHVTAASLPMIARQLGAAHERWHAAYGH